VSAREIKHSSYLIPFLQGFFRTLEEGNMKIIKKRAVVCCAVTLLFMSWTGVLSPGKNENETVGRRKRAAYFWNGGHAFAQVEHSSMDSKEHTGHGGMESPGGKTGKEMTEKQMHAEPLSTAHDMSHGTSSWADPDIKISPPPPLMGIQMGMVHTLNVPPLGFEMVGDVKVFRLIAQPVEHVLTEGRMPDQSIVKEANRYTGGLHHAGGPNIVKFWGYNGTVPGPTIEAYEGDLMRIILTNELPEPTSIHWHGLEVPNEMDGAGGVTQPPVMPGWGLGGMFVIHPRRYQYNIDKDFAIMLGAFAFLPGNDLPDLITMDFNWFTFNGKVAPDIEVMNVSEGDRVRIRFSNLTMDSHPIHIHGHTWKVVGTEGGPIPESAQWPGSTINIPPGTTRDVEFVAWNPGVWRLHCHKLHHIINAHADVPMGIMPHGGMFTYFHVLPR
jgi:hypothetical protein